VREPGPERAGGAAHHRIALGWSNVATTPQEEERAMARIKHIALSTDDPAKTAEFYKNVFGLTELRRVPADTGADGVWLSDGYIYFAVLKYGGEDTPNLGEGPSTVKDIHHIGFYVDDIETTSATLEDASCTECPGSSKVNRKYKGPDGLMIDVRARGWDEQIKARMPLYQLTPAARDEAPAR
jgi:catechol 2,3-dioxygenase-like lactoylglutathione lyase family enzyme